MNTKQNKRSKLVLIDANGIFRELMMQCADSHGISLDCFDSVMSMGTVGSFEDYDGVIIESEEGTLTGIEVGEYLSKFFIEKPMIMISEGLSPSGKNQLEWPSAIQGFVHKFKGPDAILNRALEVC